MAGGRGDRSSASDGAPRLCFVYNRDLSTFIERDWNIVRVAFPQSRLFRFTGMRDARSLKRALGAADLCLAWFGARHAVAAAWLKPRAVPLVVVAGGYDVARLPELGYGTFAHPLRAAIARRMFARTERVLAVSQFTAHAAAANAGVAPERIRVIHHGFDADAWPLATGPRDVDAVTVAGDEFLVKGLDLIFGAAAAHPERRFEIIGPVDARALVHARLTPPPNVALVGPLHGAELRRRLAQARVYLQPSRHESFGCAVAEAMLTGCIPVLTRAGALPEVAGDAAIYAEAFTPAALSRALEAAWAAPETARTAARRRIETEFPLAGYAERLIDCLREAAAAGG
jgi:glycosyltransferase involved in cell wall biosynthesis